LYFSFSFIIRFLLCHRKKSITKQLTPLPSPEHVPSVPYGTVILYKDSNWGSRSYTIRTSDYLSGVRHTISQSLFDEATYVAYNLPPGVVLTLIDNVKSAPEGNPYDYRDCGATADLVGTGESVGVDLTKIGLNDKVSQFVWRAVSLELGALELWEHSEYQGNKLTIFLSEWSSGDVHSIGTWNLQDKITSMKWRTLNDRQTVDLFDNSDGTGDSYQNVKGWGDTKEISNLKDIRMNDKISSFRWNPVLPKKEVIAPFHINTNSASSGFKGLTATQAGTNDSTATQSIVLNITNTTAQSVSTTTTDTFVTGIKSNFSYTSKASPAGVGTDWSWSVELSFSYTRTNTVQKTITDTVALSVSQTTNIPASSTFEATLLVKIGQLPETTYHTTAERWYELPLTGSVADPSNNGWYKRVEPVHVLISGGLAASTELTVKSQPISK